MREPESDRGVGASWYGELRRSMSATGRDDPTYSPRIAISENGLGDVDEGSPSIAQHSAALLTLDFVGLRLGTLSLASLPVIETPLEASIQYPSIILFLSSNPGGVDVASPTFDVDLIWRTTRLRIAAESYQQPQANLTKRVKIRILHYMKT